MSKLKTYILLGLLLATSSCVFSQSHPKLILTQKGVTEIRAHLSELPMLQSSLQKSIDFVDAEMEKGIDVPVPKDMAGGYTHNRHKKNYLLMQKAGVLFQITQEEKYAVYVRDMLMEYAKMYPTLGLHPANRSYAPGKIFWQNLNDANWLVYTSQAYDCVYDWLSSKERKKLEKNLFRPFADHLSVDSPQFYNRVHNHSTWGNAAVGMIGFVMNDQELIDRAFYGLKSDNIKADQKDNDGGLIKMQGDGKAGFFAQLDHLFSPDGYYTEGPYYQRYAMYPFVMFAEAIENCKPEVKIFEYRDGLLIKAVKTLLNLTDVNGLFFPINDAQKGMSYLSRELVSSVDIIYHFGGQDSGLLSVAEKQGQVMLDDTGLSVAMAIKEGKQTAYQKKSANYKDGASGTEGALGILRAGEGDKEVCLVMKNTSQGMGHGHFDKLSFSLYDDMGEVLPDYGCARYVNIEQKFGGGYLHENNTWAKQTVAHNTLVVDRISHFGGSTDTGNEFHSDPYFFDASHENIQIISAKENNAYPGVEMHRTLALITDKRFEKPLVLDVFRVNSEVENQYELPYHFLGQVLSTNYKYDVLETLTKMGESNGYQHLRLEAKGQSKSNNAKLSWFVNDRFYSLTTYVNPEDELLFVRSGATDPNYNLRREPAFVIQKNKQKNAVFVSVVEAHGNYDRVTEFANNAFSSISKVNLLVNTDEYTAVSFQDIKENKWMLILANKDARKENKHQLKVNGLNYEWTGAYHFISAQ
ncbi:alginate lyase family protein [Ancylomarina sp. 16SWW S1-10-2]|uniref:alginate lyase family protein n=1 Tax=Ancylomarina sp. 16SWW S1-10-2 TaxID=2499681 RepID=UPI0012AE6494|nr:alginate lyase family protein [Ancylomarina sp. 16SWW S1-10-2]MRT92498.1 alginate lyase family protein [Ancylomarina sp. 16SWW S1-10-2]